MNDDFRDRSTPPPPAERPLTTTGAVFWFLLATVGAMLFITATHMLRPGSESDLVNAVACQAVAYGVTTVLLVRTHAASRSLSEAFALRSTHPAFYLLGALLGLTLQIPAELLQRFIFHFSPMDPEILQLQADMLRMDSTLQRFMIPFVVVVLGPIVEEVFFRGALFGGMRRDNSAWMTILMVSVLFAGAHGSVKLFVPLLMVGSVLTLLRFVSGSLWPCLIAHMVFNAVAVVGMALGLVRIDEDPEPLPVLLSVGGVVASLLLIAMLLALAQRSDAAHRARLEDLT